MQLTSCWNSRCTSIAWVPGGDGTFVVAHADGNLYIYDKVNSNISKNVSTWLNTTVTFYSAITKLSIMFFRTRKVALILHYLSSRTKLNFLLLIHGPAG